MPNAELLNFTVDGSLFPPFDPNEILYSIFLPKGAQSITVTATSADSKAVIVATTGFGGTQLITSGVASPPLAVASSGTLTLTVMAFDGVTSMIYYFRTYFLQGSDSSLQTLSFSSGVLSTTFTPSVLNYTATFAFVEGTTILSAVSTDSAAAITVGTGNFQRGKTSQTVTVSSVPSVLRITVTSESGAYKTVYSVSLRAQKPPPSPPSPPGTPVAPDYSRSNPPPSNPPPAPPNRLDLHPVVQFASVPQSPTKDSSAQIAFYATNSTGGGCIDCSFHCALDGGSLGDCNLASPPLFDPVLQAVKYSVGLSSLTEGSHTFRVSASSGLGYSSAPVGYSWVIDTTPPVTSITANVPTGRLTSIQNAVFTVTARDQVPGGRALESCPECVSVCSMDGGTFFACAQGQPISFFLQPGQHVFAAKSMDAAGNEEASPAQLTFTIDITPPQARFTLVPVPLTGSNRANFQFVASIGGSQLRCANCTFQCQLDQQAAQLCTQGSGNTAGMQYMNLTNGAHTFSLTTTDPDGVLTSTLSYTWTAVLIGPDVGILYHPPNLTALTNATFKFSTISSGTTVPLPVQCPGCVFQCSLDSSPARACDSVDKTVYTQLPEGVHIFSVCAVDVFGNVGAQAKYTWRVNISLPLSMVTSGPDLFGVTNSSTAVLSFVATVKNVQCAGCMYDCQLNGDPFLGCDAGMPMKLLGLKQGLQSLVIQVTDLHGATAVSAPYEWIVDTVPPTVTIQTAPPPISSSSTASFSLSATDLVGGNSPDCSQCTYRCSLDSGLFRPCENPVIFSHLGLTGGLAIISFSAVSVDLAGNRALIPAAYKWTVDLRAPIIHLLTAPSNPSNLKEGTLTFFALANEDSFDCSNCSVICSIDSQAPFPCNPTANSSLAVLPFAALSEGPHSATVTYTNPLGVAANYTHFWFTDVTSPAVQLFLPKTPARQNPFQISIKISEACFGFDCVSVTSCEVLIQGQALPDPPSFSSSGSGVYTLSVLPISDGWVDILIPAGACSDAAGNPSLNAIASVYWETGPSLPSISAVDLSPIQIGGGNLSWTTNKAPVTFVLDFGRHVTGFNLSGVVVKGGRAQGLTSPSTAGLRSSVPLNGTESGGSPLEASPASRSSLVTINAPGEEVPSTRFLFQVWPLQDGQVTVQILSNSCTDEIGSPNSASDAFTFVFDTSVPAVTLVLSHVVAPQQDSMYILVEFSERVAVFSQPPADSGPISGRGFGPSQVSVEGCQVASCEPQPDGISYVVMIRSEVSRGRVWIAAGAVTDLAGNQNAASNVLTVSFGISSSLVAAGDVSASFLAGGLATATGLSGAAILPSVVAQIASLPGIWAANSPGTLTLYSPRGNLVGVIGTVQTFALLRKLAVPQSPSFSKAAGSLAWVNLESRPSLPVVSPPSAAPANGTNGPPPLGSGRRLLELNGTAASSSPTVFQLFEIPGPRSLRVPGFIFGGIFLVLGAASLGRSLLALLWRRLSSARLPDPLLFPRLEILAGLLTYYPFTQACAVLMQGGSALEVFLGSLLLILVPCGAIVAVLMFVGMHVVSGTRISFKKDSWQLFEKDTWQQSLRTVFCGSPCRGVWVESAECGPPDFAARPKSVSRPLGRFGPLFQLFRPPNPDCVGTKKLVARMEKLPAEKSAARKRTAGKEGSASEEGAPSRISTQADVTLADQGGGRAYASVSGRVACFCSDLVRMLRTCHMGAVLTKRLVFGACLGVFSGGVVAANGPNLVQVTSLLVTSFAYVSWLVVGKPYLSRAVQGVETLAGFLELLTLCLALFCGKFFENGAAARASTSARARTLSDGMLALQLLSIGAQAACQWWAALCELRARWLWWKEERERRAAAESGLAESNLGLGGVTSWLEEAEAAVRQDELGLKRAVRFRSETFRDGRDHRGDLRESYENERIKFTGKKSKRREAEVVTAKQPGVRKTLTSPTPRDTNSNLDGRSPPGRRLTKRPTRKGVGSDRIDSPRAKAVLEIYIRSTPGATPQGHQTERQAERISGTRLDKGRQGAKLDRDSAKGRGVGKSARFTDEEVREKHRVERAEKGERENDDIGSTVRPFGSRLDLQVAVGLRRGSDTNRRLVRLKSRRKETEGSMMSSFVVSEEDLDICGQEEGNSYNGGQGWNPDAIGEDWKSSNRKRNSLARLKSRKIETGHSTMAAFLVTESDEYGDGDEGTTDDESLR